MEENNNIVSEGIVEFYYFNQSSVNITPKGFASLYLRHNLTNKSGVLYVLMNQDLKNRGIYILDQIIEYNGEKYIQVNLYNFGSKPYIIEDKDIICSLILNVLVEEGD